MTQPGLIGWNVESCLLGFKMALYLIALAAASVGFLSFFSPSKSIRLYQWIMRGFNWRVEPIDERRELRNTKWLGALMTILALVIGMILFAGCAHDFVPWGYRMVSEPEPLTSLPLLDSRHPVFGVISKGKQEMLNRYGLPKYISDEALEVKRSGRKLDEWVYVNNSKRFYFFTDTGELFYEENLAPLDVASYNGYLQEGMLSEQVKRVKGRPTSIETSNLPYGATEKWVYRLDGESSDALYFSAGMLLLWQRERAGEDLLRKLPIGREMLSEASKAENQN